MTRYIVGFTLPNDENPFRRDVLFEIKVKAVSVPDAWLKARAEDPKRRIHSVQDESYLNSRGFEEVEVPPMTAE